MLTKLEANRHRWLFDPDLEDKYTENEIWLKSMGINDYKFNDDGTVDVNGDVNLRDRNLTKIPYKFGKVTGYFNCGHNKLKSLEFAPKSVGGNFYCYSNELTSLEFAPKSVSGNFNCNNNSTKFIPEDVKTVCKVGGDIIC